MSYCNSCHSYSCQCNTVWNEDVCGCKDNISSACIFYKSTATECIPLAYGQNLETILKNIDSAICALTPSGLTYTVVQGCADKITVTPSTVGNTTTYTVCLDSDITDQLANLGSDIASLQTCCDASVKTIVTDDPSTLDITDDGSGNYTINVVNPSGNTTYDGIVYNNYDTSAYPNGGGGTQIVQSFNRNYLSSNVLSNGDLIKFTVTQELPFFLDKTRLQQDPHLFEKLTNRYSLQF